MNHDCLKLTAYFGERQRTHGHFLAEDLLTLAKLDEAVADPKSEGKQQPDYCRNETRSIKPNLLIAVGICTHLGCSPSSKFKKGAEDGMPAVTMAAWEPKFEPMLRKPLTAGPRTSRAPCRAPT